MCAFCPLRPTTASGQATLTMGTHGQVRVVIAMMTGREKDRTGCVGSALWRGRKSRRRSSEEEGDEGDWEWMCFRGFEVFWLNEMLFYLPLLFS